MIRGGNFSNTPQTFGWKCAGATVEDLFVNAAEGFAELVAERRDTAPRREVFLSN